MSMIFLVLAAFCCPAQSGSVKILIPPAPMSTTEISKLTDFDRISRGLYLYLHERFAEIPEVDGVTESWAGDLLFEVSSGKRRFDPENLLRDLRAFLPLDAAVFCKAEGEQFICFLYVREETHRREFPCTSATPVGEVIYPVAEFLARSLGLSEEASTALTEKRLPDSAMLQACYLSQRLNTVWIYNSGEARLKLLRPFIEKVGKFPYMAGTTLSAGTRMSVDGRKPSDAKRNIDALRIALPAVLGTKFEREAFRFLQHNKYETEALEKELLGMVSRQAKSESERVLDDEAGDEFSGLLEGTELDATASLMAGRKTADQQAGIIRCLGILKSAEALQLMEGFAGNEKPSIRQAAAFALGQYADPATQGLLRKLANDRDPQTAFFATYWLSQRGLEMPELLSHARAVARRTGAPAEAVKVLAEVGGAEDLELLKNFSLTTDNAKRVPAIRGLLRLGRVDADTLRAWLHCGEESVVTAAMAELPEDLDDSIRGRLFELANDPHARVAERARWTLARFRPTARPDRLRFDLRTEHMYLRLKIIDELASSEEPWAIDILAEATANLEPHTRARALRKLTERAPDRALSALPALVNDPYRWVRVHAAATAAEVARPDLADVLQKALETEEDRVARLYLQDALAKAGGRPLPKPRRPVHRFDPARNTFGMCGSGIQAPASPFAYYYTLNVDQGAEAKNAHEKGKLYIGRSNETARNPIQVLFHPIWRDLWWMSMDRELADLDWLDGVVLGEESMYFGPWQLWEDGWRLFCLDAGLDPARIDSDRSRLSEYERRAWLHWEEERAIDGFNIMYDFIKLYFGKLRPGFMVGTFMPDQNGPCVADRRWKFDVAGAYYYGASNRVRYNMIRRLKTLWPERPVIWLSMANVGTPKGVVKYNSPVPTSPVQGRSSKAYADSVCAWLAGAESAFFLHWLFGTKDSKGEFGRWVAIEDAFPGSSRLEDGIAMSFQGIEAMYRFQTKEGVPKLGVPDEEAEGADDVDKLVSGRDPEKEARERVEREKERLRLGFNLEQKLLYDIARVLHGLPRPPHKRQVLFVAPREGISHFDLAGDYDFLIRINKLANHDLRSYRLIGITGHAASPLHDRTIAAVTKWLRELPGLLYVRGGLAHDNSMEASAAGDLDGKLLNDWPWEGDVEMKDGHYELTGPAAKALGDEAEPPKLVLWKKEGFRGAVLFDQATGSASELRQVLNGLAEKHGVGLAIKDPIGMQTGSIGGVTGMASTYAAPETCTLRGVDLLTGEADPVVQKGLSAAVVADRFRSTYVASYNGVSILCDKAAEMVEAVDGGLRVQCSGLIRAGSITGAASVSLRDRKAPTVIRGEEEIIKWILLSEEDGLAYWPVAGTRSVVAFVRSAGPVTITQKASPREE